MLFAILISLASLAGSVPSELSERYESALTGYSELVQERDFTPSEAKEIRDLIQELKQHGANGIWRAYVLEEQLLRDAGGPRYPSQKDHYLFPSQLGGWMDIDKLVSGRLPKAVSQMVERLPESGYFFVFAHEPKFYVDYSSLSSLAASILDIELAKNPKKSHFHVVGHIQMAWSCKLPSGESIEGATGFTGELSNQVKSMLLSGWGASSVVAMFSDGTFNLPAEVAASLRYSSENEVLSWAGQEISTQDCQSIADYFKDYHQSQFDLAEDDQFGYWFGLPLQQVGHLAEGCSSMAFGILQKLDIFTPLFRSWNRILKVPYAAMRNPDGKFLPEDTWVDENLLNQIETDTLSIFEIRKSRWQWSTSDSEGADAALIDPDLMYTSFYALTQTALGLSPIRERQLGHYLPGRLSKKRVFHPAAPHIQQSDADSARLAERYLENRNVVVEKIYQTRGAVLLQ